MFLSFFFFKFELEMMETWLWSGVWDSDWIVSDLLSTLFFEHKPIKEDKIVKQWNFFFLFQSVKMDPMDEFNVCYNVFIVWLHVGTRPDS
jgi:hypothetical protein